jgi:phosphoribosylanthranilate isomerase
MGASNVLADARRPAVKICGLREPEHAVAAAAAGADLIGFIFAPSRRRVAPGEAAACIAALHAHDERPLAVGVFVDAPADEIMATVRVAGLDLVQIHGDEPIDLLDRVDVPVIRALRPRPGESVDAVEREIARWAAHPRAPIALLIDGYSEAGAGGTGVRSDWSLARSLAERWPVLLAGGLDATNVGEAIATARPHGVDVSSGVERDGRKDPERIAAFIAAARRDNR